MIKINLATDETVREPLPAYLKGLKQESLNDLSWTDPALGVQDFGWWPEELSDTPIDTNTQKYGAEILTPDVVRKVVVTSHEVVTLTAEEQTAIVDVAKVKQDLANKAACTNYIHSFYPPEKQDSAGIGGVYDMATVDAMALFIASCVAEEDRVCALLYAATTIPELQLVESPTWPSL